MPKGYRHLATVERCQIWVLKKSGFSLNAIAKLIGVHPSTVSREVGRNSGGRGYRWKQAENLSRERRSLASSRKRVMKPEAIVQIKKLLEKQWSPVQISGRLKREEPKIEVSHETIYQYVWEDKRMGGQLYKNLRHRGKKYNKRSSKKAGRGLIPNRIGIEDRPAEVDEKNRLGDWEVDTIIGSLGGKVIVSAVERLTKYTKLVLAKGKTAHEVEDALKRAMLPISRFVKTVTADNGKEFAKHQQISEALNADFYFARPYHSWERGLNEHTNGLTRQYFPKSSDFNHLTDEDIQKVEKELNTRPRKVLDYRTPMEVFFELGLKEPGIALHT